MPGAIPPLPQFAFMAWCSVKAQGYLYLYLFYFTCCITLNEMGISSGMGSSSTVELVDLVIFEGTTVKSSWIC
jgi:hypothetical protein